MLFVNLTPVFFSNVGQYETRDIMVVLNEDVSVPHVQRIHVRVRMKDVVQRLLCAFFSLGVAKAVWEDSNRAMAENGKVTRAIGVDVKAFNDAIKRLCYPRLPIWNRRELSRWFRRRLLLLEEAKHSAYLLRANAVLTGLQPAVVGLNEACPRRSS